MHLAMLWKVAALNGLLAQAVTGFRQLAFPESNQAARDVYLGENWMNLDAFGRPRATPSILYWTELMEFLPPDSISGRETRLLLEHRLVGESDYSRILAISDNERWVIKYHAHCPDASEPEDSLLVEAYFLELLGSTGITNNVLYLSNEFHPTDFSQVKQNWAFCPGDPGIIPVMRYMISERVGISLDRKTSRKDRLPFVQALEHGVVILRLLANLHRTGAVHGDIHLGNVAYRMDGDESTENLILIDFGRAVIVDQNEEFARSEIAINDPLIFSKVEKSLVRCHEFYSPWESVNAQPGPSYRDDLFRGVLVLWSLIFGSRRMSIFECNRNYAKYFHMKASNDFFNVKIPGGRSYLESLLPYDKHRFVSGIHQLFQHLLANIRSLGYGEFPDYEPIIDTLHSILSLARDA